MVTFKVLKKENVYLRIVNRKEDNKLNVLNQKDVNDDLNEFINVSLPIILSRDKKFFKEKASKNSHYEKTSYVFKIKIDLIKLFLLD
jgi:hypothetical protein